jgi:hypothetical protein
MGLRRNDEKAGPGTFSTACKAVSLDHCLA